MIYSAHFLSLRCPTFFQRRAKAVIIHLNFMCRRDQTQILMYQESSKARRSVVHKRFQALAPKYQAQSVDTGFDCRKKGMKGQFEVLD